MMDIKILDLGFDTLIFFSGIFAVLSALLLSVTVVLLFDLSISLPVIGEASILAFFGGWLLLDWYKEVM